jgi:thiamine transport system substrate-binding protein
MGLPDGFTEALSAEQSLILPPAQAAAQRSAALDEWQSALAQ